jgi:hypothetical protein
MGIDVMVDLYYVASSTEPSGFAATAVLDAAGGAEFNDRGERRKGCERLLAQ